MPSPKTIVISDLHVGAGPLDDCDEALEQHLVSFLHELAARPSVAELVINGDFLDFAQAPPWEGSELESFTPLGIPLCFTEDQSVAKFEAITSAHASVFDSLGAFLAARDENTLVINPGNHDADFFWPKVRTRFIERVSKTDSELAARISFNLKRFFRPKAANIWIEHGHNYDPANWFYVDEYDEAVGSRIGSALYWDEQKLPILKDRTGQDRLYECVGTRFMIKFLNSLDQKFPFVDNVKPFSRFLKVFGDSIFTRGHGPLKALVAVWRMVRFLGSTMGSYPVDVLESPGAGIDIDAKTAELIVEKLKSMSDEKLRAFHEAIIARDFPLRDAASMHLEDARRRVPLLSFLADNLDLLDPISSEYSSYLDSSGHDEPGGYLTLGWGFFVDETKALTRAASTILKENSVDMVVMGHTHEPVRSLGELPYLNSGSWTRNYDFKTGTLRTWEVLRADSYKYFPYELNYVEIPNDGKIAEMKTYAKGV